MNAIKSSIITCENYHCVQIKTVLQSHQNGAEVADQPAGANCQNHIPNDCLDTAAQHIVPGLLEQYVTNDNNQANHKCGLLQNVCCKI